MLNQFSNKYYCTNFLEFVVPAFIQFLISSLGLFYLYIVYVRFS